MIQDITYLYPNGATITLTPFMLSNICFENPSITKKDKSIILEAYGDIACIISSEQFNCFFRDYSTGEEKQIIVTSTYSGADTHHLTIPTINLKTKLTLSGTKDITVSYFNVPFFSDIPKETKINIRVGTNKNLLWDILLQNEAYLVWCDGMVTFSNTIQSSIINIHVPPFVKKHNILVVFREPDLDPPIIDEKLGKVLKTAYTKTYIEVYDSDALNVLERNYPDAFAKWETINISLIDGDNYDRLFKELKKTVNYVKNSTLRSIAKVKSIVWF